MKIDVIALVQQAGATPFEALRYKTHQVETCYKAWPEELDRFAQLIQQATAAECAKLCHAQMMELRYSSCEFSDDADMKSDGAEVCADAIRAIVRAAACIAGKKEPAYSVKELGLLKEAFLSEQMTAEQALKHFQANEL